MLTSWSFKNKVLLALSMFVAILAGYGAYVISALKSVSHNPTLAAKLAEQYTTSIIAFTLVTVIISIVFGWSVTRYLTNILTHFTKNISRGANHLEKSSKEIASAGSMLATSTHQQSVALQQTASALVEVNSMISKNSEGSSRTDNVIKKSQETAIRGKQQVFSLMKSIEGISSSQDEILHEIEGGNQRISEIVKLISEIGEKTKVINEIVFQTKILSFNASVEAARAGEHGKGFAVVAQEVGNLAQMSGVAAEEISNMLSDSIGKVEGIISTTTNNVSTLVSNGRSKVSEGTSLAKSCNEILEEVVTDISSAQVIMNEISLASREQSQGIDEINKAIHELDKATNQNAQAAHSTSTGSESLYIQAAELKTVTEEMNRFIYGAKNQVELFNVTRTNSRRTSAQQSYQNKNAEINASVKSEPKTQEVFDKKPEVKSSAKVVAKYNNEKNKPEVKKVVSIEQAKSHRSIVEKRAADGTVKKVVAGTDIPLESDPRFEDV